MSPSLFISSILLFAHRHSRPAVVVDDPLIVINTLRRQSIDLLSHTRWQCTPLIAIARLVSFNQIHFLLMFSVICCLRYIQCESARCEKSQKYFRSIYFLLTNKKYGFICSKCSLWSRLPVPFSLSLIQRPEKIPHSFVIIVKYVHSVLRNQS